MTRSWQVALLLRVLLQGGMCELPHDIFLSLSSLLSLLPCLPVCLSACLSVCLSVCLSLSLSLSLFTRGDMRIMSHPCLLLLSLSAGRHVFMSSFRSPQGCSTHCLTSAPLSAGRDVRVPDVRLLLGIEDHHPHRLLRVRHHRLDVWYDDVNHVTHTVTPAERGNWATWFMQ